jgi:hypothetical protein
MNTNVDERKSMRDKQQKKNAFCFLKDFIFIENLINKLKKRNKILK